MSSRLVKIILPIFGFGLVMLFLFAISPKLNHTYLEDDLLWLLPVIEQISNNHSFFGAFELFCKSELTPFNGYYYMMMISLFGFDLKAYSLFSLGLFFISAILFYLLLARRIKLNAWVSISATLMYVTFFGHFHVYLWSIAVHHLFAMVFILLALNLYLKTEEVWENRRARWVYYVATMFVILMASFMRMSILILPVVLLMHILLFQRDENVILKKLDVWLPGIFLIIAGQLFFILVVRQQYILDGLIAPVKEFFGDFTLLWVFPFSLLLVLGIRFGVYLLIRIKVFRFFQRGLEFLALGWFLLPQYMGLSLYLWARPIIPDAQLNPLMRLQIMNFPQTLLLTIVLYALTAILMCIFSFYVKKRNNLLMIFLVWSMTLFFFFDYKPEEVQSRYLIYIMPSLACLISCLLFEILPNFFKPLVQQRLRVVFFAGIVLISGLNVLGIQQRLAQTILSNVIWSYDYIKQTHMIADDLEKTNIINSHADTTVCINNVQPIPYFKEFGFLDNYKFRSEDAFILTMKSVLPGKDLSWRVNESCQEKDYVYKLTDVTVYDPAGKNLASKATYPFVFQLFLDMDQRFWLNDQEKLVRAKAIIEPISEVLPNDDSKMTWIKRMLQQEILDYERKVDVQSF